MLIVVCNDACFSQVPKLGAQDRVVGGIKHFLETGTTIFAICNTCNDLSIDDKQLTLDDV